MAATSYETLANIQMELGLADSDTGKASPTNLQFLADAVTAEIARYCGREFNLSTTTMTFELPASETLWIPDAYQINSVAVDGVALSTAANTDYLTEPFQLTNVEPHFRALKRITGLRGQPRNWADHGNLSLATINAAWGYASAVPPPVVEACRVQTIKLYEREVGKYATKSGSSAGRGAQSRLAETPTFLDDIVCAMLNPYRLRWPRTNKPAWQGAL